MFGWRKSEPKKVWQTRAEEPVVSRVLGKPITKPAEELRLQDAEEESHKRIYQETLHHFQTTDKYPLTEGGTDSPAGWAPLNDQEKCWLSKECLLRYLRACNWDKAKTIERLTSTIGWRREFGIAGGEYMRVTADVVAVENETGKQQIFGYDTHHRPCLILMTGRQNTPASERQIQHLIFMLERAIDFMPQGQDKLCLCVEFKKYPESCPYESMIPPVGVGKQVLHILQYHYPERLGRAMFINMPTLANIFLKLCWPFVDPYTKQKCKFNEPFSEYVGGEMLAYNFGGDVNFEYDHAEYWDDFVSHAAAKQAAILANYNNLGGGVGLSEYHLRKGI